MFVQKFFKGIRGLGRLEAEHIFAEGLRSNRLRLAPAASYTDLIALLTEDNLYGHVTDYATYGAQSVFVSLTAGTRGATSFDGFFRPFAAWETALRFATAGGKSTGVVLEGWVIVLGTPAWHIPGVAEDIRDRHVYPRFNNFWAQGEVTAKLVVPGSQITRVTMVDADLSPIETVENPLAMEPAEFSNIREAI